METCFGEFPFFEAQIASVNYLSAPQTARLALFQQTYGKFEVWSVDDDGNKWIEYELEFQWNTSDCIWTTAFDPIDCPLLPLTSDTEKTYVEKNLCYAPPKHSILFFFNSIKQSSIRIDIP